MAQMSPTKAAWSTGGMLFAAVMMFTLGAFQFLQGLAAVIKSEFFVVAPNYTFEIDTTAWGWIHLIIGATVAIVGFFLFSGAQWARVIGIVVAVISAISQFFFLPYYPIWAIVIIAMDVFVIWALATAPRDMEL